MEEDVYNMHLSENFTPPNIVDVVKFSNLQSEVTIFDRFCINPDCDCRDVTLLFYEMVEKRNKMEKLFEIVLNIDTWRKVKMEAARKDIDCESMVKEFFRDFDRETRLKIKKRFEDGKKYGGDIVREDINYSSIEKNQHVYYAEIFNPRDYENLYFEYKGVKYFVLDSYCINPNCYCYDAVLSFFEEHLLEETLSPLFSVEVKFEEGKYEVLERSNGVDSKDLKEIYHCFLKYTDDEDLNRLKMRYWRMKKVSIDLGLCAGSWDPSNSIRTVKKEKIGRNTPCPCGSGKKYKKCCGR